MPSTSTINDRQQPPTEPSQDGADHGQPITLLTILRRVQSRQEAVEDARDGDAAAAVPSPAPAISMSLEVHAKPSKRRFSNKIVSTKRLHNDAGREDFAPSFYWVSDALTPQPAGDRKEQ